MGILIKKESKPQMSDGNIESVNNGIFTIKDPKEYLGGHIAIGLTLIAQTAVPIILKIYYADRYPNDRLEGLTKNVWYQNAWYSLAYGGASWVFWWPAMAWLFAFIPQEWSAKSFLFLFVTFGIYQGLFAAAQTIIF